MGAAIALPTTCHLRPPPITNPHTPTPPHRQHHHKVQRQSESLPFPTHIRSAQLCRTTTTVVPSHSRVNRQQLSC